MTAGPREPVDRLRVACVIGGMQAGGAERVMAQLCNYFAVRGHDVTLVTLAPAGEESFYELSEAVRYWPMGRAVQGRWLGRPGRVATWIARLRRTFVQLQPDVVISFIELTNVMILLATLGLRIPVVVSERIDPGAYRARLSRLERWLCRLTYPRAARIAVQTARAADFFRDYPAAKLVTIPNPVPAALATARPDATTSDGRYRIIGVGRLDPQKGFDRLIDSFAGLAARFPQWDVAIFGQGPERAALLSQIERHGLSDRIRLMGVTKDIAAEYARAHVMAFPSRYEGFPNALAEGMAAGLPAVAFEDVSGVEDLIVADNTGLLARDSAAAENAIQSLTEQLRRLLESAALRARLGAAARERIGEFRPDIVMTRWDDLVAAVIRENRR